jgi:hypothetical protein
MQLKKLVAAGAMGLIMAGSTLAMAADLANYPAPFVDATTGEITSLVVVGNTAAAEDIVGAIDVAARMGSVGKTSTVSGGSVTVAVDGKSKEVSMDADPTAQLGTSVKDTKVPYLTRTEIVYNATLYDVYEEITLASGLKLENAPDKDQTNGTLYIKLAKASNKVGYKYVFAETMSTPGLSVDYPLAISFLGGERVLSITAVTASSFTVLTGLQGTLDLDTLSADIGEYTISVSLFENSDKTRTKYAVTKGSMDFGETKFMNATSGFNTDTLTSGSTSVKVQVIEQIRGYSPDGTEIWRVKMLVGNETTKTINNNDEFDSDTNYRWDISFTGSNSIAKNDYVGIHSANPENDTNVELGEKFSFYNDYFEFGVPSLTVPSASFKEVSFTPKTSLNVYKDSQNRTCITCPGLEVTGASMNISTDDYTKLYIVFNQTAPTENITYFLAKDNSNWDKIENITTPQKLNFTSGDTVIFDIYNDEVRMNVHLQGAGLANTTRLNLTTSTDQFWANYTFNETTNKIWLGENASGHNGIYMTTNDATYHLNEVGYDSANGDLLGPISDVGVVVVQPYANANVNKLVLKIPTETVKANVAIGKIGATTSTGGSTVQETVPVTQSVARLAKEVPSTSAARTEKNFVLVGGPCANQLVAELATAGKFDYTCDAWTMASGEALIKVIDDAFATGKSALVVAGTDAADTVMASRVLLNYDAYTLSGAAVKVTGTAESPVVTAV